MYQIYLLTYLFFFWNVTLHVSDGLSAHHQEFKTVHTATCICQTDTAVCLLAGTASKQTAVNVWQMPVAVCTVLNSWWWTERQSKTCRVSFQNKFDTLVHLVGFTIEISQWCCKLTSFLYFLWHKSVTKAHSLGNQRVPHMTRCCTTKHS